MIKGLRIFACGLTITLLSLCWSNAQTPTISPLKEIPSFGVLKSPSVAEVRAQAEGWLKTRPALSPEQQKGLEQIWASTDSSSDKLAETFALADADAAKVLSQARESVLEPPSEIPALLKDATKPLFLRANLAVAYSRILSQNKVYEMALDTLKIFKPEQVADPSSYLFHRAVAEYSLMMKKKLMTRLTAFWMM